MKGYVKVTNQQLQEAISGFGRRYSDGKVIRDKGIELYYDKYYVNGNAWTRFFNRNRTPIQFARNRMSGFFVNWSDVLDTVLTDEETDLLDWWCWTGSGSADHLKTMMSQSSDGFALVDHEIARQIEVWSGYK